MNKSRSTENDIKLEKMIMGQNEIKVNWGQIGSPDLDLQGRLGP